MIVGTIDAGMQRRSSTRISVSTSRPPLKPAIGVESASGSTSIAMPLGGRPLVTAKPTPAARSAATASIDAWVRVLSDVTSVPSTSERTRSICPAVTAAGTSERARGVG